jgi:hypothetical protein
LPIPVSICGTIFATETPGGQRDTGADQQRHERVQPEPDGQQQQQRDPERGHRQQVGGMVHHVADNRARQTTWNPRNP